MLLKTVWGIFLGQGKEIELCLRTHGVLLFLESIVFMLNRFNKFFGHSEIWPSANGLLMFDLKSCCHLMPVTE